MKLMRNVIAFENIDYAQDEVWWHERSVTELETWDFEKIYDFQKLKLIDVTMMTDDDQKLMFPGIYEDV
jgi:hypothetical protein